VEVDIIDDCRRNHIPVERFCLHKAAVPLPRGELTLTCAHQRVEFRARCVGQVVNGTVQRGDFRGIGWKRVEAERIGGIVLAAGGSSNVNLVRAAVTDAALVASIGALSASLVRTRLM